MLTRRQFLKRCATTIMAANGVSLLSSGILRASVALPILLYHRVGPEHDALTVSADRFKQDMKFLTESGYKTISLEQAKEYFMGRRAIEGKSVLLTFDDGYKDNYFNVFPILQKFSMVGSFFVITGMFGQPSRMDKLLIREMLAAGMSFGSHTVSHRQLATLPADDIVRELQWSKSDLEETLGRPVEFISYPCGSYNRETLKVTHDTGYIGGLTTNSGIADLTGNSLTLNRIPVFHWDHSLYEIMLRKGLLSSTDSSFISSMLHK